MKVSFPELTEVDGIFALFRIVKLPTPQLCTDIEKSVGEHSLPEVTASRILKLCSISPERLE